MINRWWWAAGAALMGWIIGVAQLGRKRVREQEAAQQRARAMDAWVSGARCDNCKFYFRPSALDTETSERCMHPKRYKITASTLLPEASSLMGRWCSMFTPDPSRRIPRRTP